MTGIGRTHSRPQIASDRTRGPARTDPGSARGPRREPRRLGFRPASSPTRTGVLSARCGVPRTGFHPVARHPVGTGVAVRAAGPAR